MIDLCSNENPNPIEEKTLKTINNNLKDLNRYIDSNSISMLKKEIAKYCNVNEKRIIIGPGTNYLFDKIILKFAKDNDTLVLNPTFLHSIDNIKYVGGKISRLQLIPPNFKVDWNKNNIKPKLYLIEYPDNPTGKCLISKSELLQLLKNKENLVVIDEAGYEYCGKTFMDLVDEHPNLSIIRTFDKAFALAGLKVSWMVAGDKFLERINSKDTLINKAGLSGALAVLKNKKYFLECAEQTISQRELMFKKLKSLGLEVFSSKSNFLLVKTEIPDFAIRLREKGILIGDLSQFWISGYYRITIGSPKANEILVESIKDIKLELNQNL